MTQRVLLMISSMRGGGSERQTLLLLKHLDRELFTTHVYLTERAGDLLQQLPSDVTVHSFDEAKPTGGFYFPGRVMRQQVAHLRNLIQQESIDAIYDRTFHMTMIAGAATKSSGVRRVSTIVSPPHRALPLVEQRFVWLKKLRLAAAYKQSSQVVAVSEQAASSARSFYGLSTDDVKVILNPVDIVATQKAAQQSSGDLPTHREGRTLVCVGRMTEEKGHADLIDALAMSETQWPADVAPLQVWLIGDGPLRCELQMRCEQKLGKHDVHFLGIHRNPAPAIEAADALILPSHFEGMPNVVLESMAIGTPVIATRAGGTIELERDEPTILWAEPQNPSSLSQAILQFATLADMNVYAEAATRLVHSHHDIRQTTRTIEQLLTG